MFLPGEAPSTLPDDKDLARLGAESYAGVPLMDVHGHCLGHLVVMDTKPRAFGDHELRILRIFSTRAGAEAGTKPRRSFAQAQRRMLLEINNAVITKLSRDELWTAIADRCGGLFLSTAWLCHSTIGRLVKVNCGAIPAGVVESELFGHEKGAFTGATQRRIGRFELADGGSIFLDEVTELPVETQVKLLRVLQEGDFERVGSSQTIKVDVRVIAATNRDVQEAV